MSELTATEMEDLQLWKTAMDGEDNPTMQACRVAAVALADRLRLALPDVSDAAIARVMLALGFFHAQIAKDDRAKRAANVELLTAVPLAEAELTQ